MVGVSGVGGGFGRLLIGATALLVAGAAQAGVSVLPAGVLFPPGGALVTFDDQPASNHGVALGNVTLGGIEFSGGGMIFVGSRPGVSAKPLNDNTPYLSVLCGEEVTLKFPTLNRRFGMYVGSLDTYNYVDFYRHNSLGQRVLLGSYSGTRIDQLTPMVASGDPLSNKSNRYVQFSFSDAKAYDTIVLRSTRNAFEIDNISAPIPEPATWVMMLMGFAALGVAARRRGRTEQGVARGNRRRQQPNGFQGPVARDRP